MKEEFIHYIWRYRLLHHSKLITAKREKINIISPGVYNSNSGPDFLNAKLEINEQLWVGNIEMHVKASDWYVHQHEIDSNYDAVILHVVWENDIDVFMKNNIPIPTLELKHKVALRLLKNYESLLFQKINWIPCENQLLTVSSFIIENWMERLFIERLEEKSKIILQLLADTKNDYEAVLFQMLAKNFGLKVNSESFFKLSTSFSFLILRRVRRDTIQILALLFGQAGFLEESITHSFYKKLKTEYEYLKHKYQLRALDKNYFQFFRMRPSNFPTRRIAQLGGLYAKHEHLFSEILKKNKVIDFYNFFEIKMHPFWDNHYTFEKATKKKISQRLTKSFVDLVIINTIIPLKYVYFKNNGILKHEELIDLMQSITPEKNSIIANFKKLKIHAKNAFETQALLQLKTKYCDYKKCLNCAIGSELIRSKTF